MLVFDSHALLWWCFNPEKLSEPARAACERVEAGDGGLLSAISIWEIGLKIKRGKLDLGITIERYVEQLRSLNLLEIVPVDTRTWLKNLALDWEHRDPVDRTIVALATLRGLPVLTKDGPIRAFYTDCIW